jgi:hypothetical protein
MCRLCWPDDFLFLSLCYDDQFEINSPREMPSTSLVPDWYSSRNILYMYMFMISQHKCLVNYVYICWIRPICHLLQRVNDEIKPHRRTIWRNGIFVPSTKRGNSQISPEGFLRNRIWQVLWYKYWHFPYLTPKAKDHMLSRKGKVLQYAAPLHTNAHDSTIIHPINLSTSRPASNYDVNPAAFWKS